MYKLKKIYSLLFIALFVSCYVGTTFFSHAHIINGATIIHSHVHANSHHDTNNGGHTEHCITLISNSSHFESVDFLNNAVLLSFQFPILRTVIVEITHRVASIYHENISLRAPPSLA